MIKENNKTIPSEAKKEFIKLCEGFKVAKDLIDFNYLYDCELSINENLNENSEIYKQILLLSISQDLNEAKANELKNNMRAEQQTTEQLNLIQLKQEAEHTKTELNKAIESILNQNKEGSLLNEFFKPLESFVKIVSNSQGYLNSLFVWGDGGLGKTTAVLKSIKEAGKQFIYYNNYTTILELYNFLYEHKNDIIIFDDFENIFNMGAVAVNILKGALWGIGKENKRIISYLTTSDKLTAPNQFEFNGKMIFLLNELPKENKLINALFSRSLVYELKTDYDLFIKLLTEMSLLPYRDLNKEQRTEILSFILSKINKTTKDLNFRLLIKTFDIYIENKEKWKELTDILIKGDKTLIELKNCVDTTHTIKEAELKFCEITGYSRATFFRLKNKLYD